MPIIIFLEIWFTLKQTTYSFQISKTRHRHKSTSQRFSTEFFLWRRIHLTTKTGYQNQTGLEHPLSLMKFPSEIYCAFIKTGSKVASAASGYSWVILVQVKLAITKIFNALKRQLWQNLFCLKIKREHGTIGYYALRYSCCIIGSKGNLLAM